MNRHAVRPKEDSVLLHAEIAQRLGISKARVQQIEAAAIRKIWRKSVNPGLYAKTHTQSVGVKSTGADG